MDHPVPPRMRDRVAGMLERHPWELTFMGWWMLAGAKLVTASFVPTFDPSPSLLALPGIMCAIMGAPMLAGGVLVLTAMLRRWDNLADKWRAERAGLTIGAAAWIGYAMAVAWYRPESSLPYGMALATAAAALWRVRSSRREEHAIRTTRGH